MEEFVIKHSYREGNGIVDEMVVLGLDIDGLTCWHEIDNIHHIGNMVKEEGKIKN